MKNAHEKAMEDFQEAINLDPKNSNILKLLRAHVSCIEINKTPAGVPLVKVLLSHILRVRVESALSWWGSVSMSVHMFHRLKNSRQ